ncbi:MAG: NAD-dependent epimerase/dehydratase family protein [Pseudomonadota bacterium]
MTSQPLAVAVTGATGFIGGHLLRELARRGHRISALARRDYEPPADLPAEVEWVRGRLGDPDALARLTEGADATIHLAGLTKARSKEDFFAINADGAGHMAAAARRAGCRVFVLASSLAAREPQLSDYAASKRAGEDAVKAEAGDMTVSIVRVPAVFGPNDPATKPILDMMRAGWLPAPGGPRGKFSLMFVTDLARALADLTVAPAPPAVYSPVGVAEADWDALAAAAGESLGKRVRVLRIPPFLLKTAAFAAETAGAALGRANHFNSGKVREMLHVDWTGDTQVAGALSLSRAMDEVFGVDAGARNRQTGTVQEFMG